MTFDQVFETFTTILHQFYDTVYNESYDQHLSELTIEIETKSK